MASKTLSHRSELSQARLMELLDYDQETGIFRWTVNRSHAKKDAVAGSIHKVDKYCHIGIDGIKFLAQRLAWLYVKGEWPDGDIDHRDTNKSNNIFENLRIATQTQNRANMRARCDNILGIKGVSRTRNGKKFRAVIKAFGKMHHLGHFDTAEEANRIYERAAKRAYGEFARSS